MATSAVFCELPECWKFDPESNFQLCKTEFMERDRMISLILAWIFGALCGIAVCALASAAD
jgi:hypothetical protein